LFVAGTDGTSPRRVFDRFIDEDSLFGWAWHPDGRVTLLGYRRQHAETALHTVDLEGASSVVTPLPPTLQAALQVSGLGEFVWAPTGAALYFESSQNFVWNLWRLDIDAATLKAGALTRLTAGAGQDRRLALARDGRKLAFTTRSEAIRIWAYSLDPSSGRVVGDPQPVTDPTTAVPGTAALSPDGRRLAYSITGVGTGRWELWTADLLTGQKQLLSRDDYARYAPQWSRDGSRLVYQWDRSRTGIEYEQAIAVRAPSGGDETLLSQPARHVCQPHGWSPDGNSILLTVWRPDQRARLALWPIASAPHADRDAAVLAADPDHELWQGRFSPDGRWVSFLALKGGAGAAAVCVIPSTARNTGAAEWTCLTDPAVWTDKPRWSSDGKLLYVWRLNGSLFNVWAVPFDGIRGRQVGAPFRVTDLESPARRIWSDQMGFAEPSVAANRMTLPIADTTGSVWMLDNADK